MSGLKKLLSCTALLLVTACGDATVLKATTYSAMDGWPQDSHLEAYKVFADSCNTLATKSNAYRSKVEGPVGVRQNWARVCTMASLNPETSDPGARQFFEANFTPYKVETESKAKGTDTGYYEPIIKGSHTKQAPFIYPVYGMPDDLGSRKPYFTREEIENGALKGRAKTLLYVDDPVMLFFLHIQGSGKVRLPDGSLIGLQYAGQNGHPFVPIGRMLKERGVMSNVSMQAIRDWLRANPGQRDEVMNSNPSYIFFKLSPGNEMAKGALGIPLTPLRSIAVDDDRAAYGVPTYLDTYVSEYPTSKQVKLQRLFVSQDTGGALKGPHRADIFFGRGETEEWQAGHQNAQGDTYWLLPVNEGTMLRDGLPLTSDELEALREQQKQQQEPTPAADVIIPDENTVIIPEEAEPDVTP